MKNKAFNKNIAVYLILALMALFVSTKLARAMYQYDVVVDGLLGMSNLYLIYVLLIRSNASASKLFDARIEFPNDLKYILWSFLLWLVIYWSARHIIVAISYMKDEFFVGI